MLLAALLACRPGVAELAPTPTPPAPVPGPVPLPDPATTPTATTPTTILPERPIDATHWTDITDVDGTLAVAVEIDADHRSFMLSVQAEDWVAVEQVVGPDGTVVLDWNDWWTSDETLTWAVFAWNDTSVLNWPIRPEEGALEPGTYVVDVVTFDGSSAYASSEVTIDLFRTADPDPAITEVHVAVYWATGVGTPEVVSATETGIDRLRDIWASQGITLVERYAGEAPVDADMRFIYTGSPELVDVLAEKPPEEVVVVVGEAYGGGYEGFFGVTGGIPGTLAPSPWTWTTVSWLAHAGVDATFTTEEATWMGDTMAHEIGHYLGLVHPVECPWDCVQSFDAITDTPRCDGWMECEVVVGDNLMYPYAICDADGCEDQSDLTADQVHVMEHYTGAL